jgi:hypothetical protein
MGYVVVSETHKGVQQLLVSIFEVYRGNKPHSPTASMKSRLW